MKKFIAWTLAVTVFLPFLLAFFVGRALVWALDNVIGDVV